MTRRFVLPLAALSLLSLVPVAARATDYYVSPLGNDANAGTSAVAPWKTLAKVNARGFVAGDRVLLQGGQVFAGSLSFDAGDSGSAANPIVVSSYGTGRATISAGTANGLFAYNTAGITVSNLVVTGSGASTNTKGGIEFYNDLAGNVKLQHVHVDNVDVSGFRRGIVLGAWNGTSGYDDVRITNSVAHHNQREGVMTYAQSLYGHRNVYVGHCVFHDNLGDPAWAAPTGNGVVLAEVDGGVIERSVAYNNGINSQPGWGPVGIWAYNSNNVVIQFCESYANRTSGTTDGGGFDLDIAMTNSVMQYNYSHDNDGAGYGLYQGTGAASWSNNVVRYNISQNDGRRNNYGAITVWSGGPVMSNCDIYGNTIFTGPSTTGAPRAVRFNSASTNFRFFNNLLVTTGGVRLLEVPSGQTGIVFAGNDYWSSGGAFSISWNGSTYSSLAAWSTATGQEKDGAVLLGRSVDPLLSSPGGGGTIGDPDLLETLAAYRLQASSPMIDAGLDLTARYGIDEGSRDYYGSSLPQGAALDVGAHEVASAGCVGDSACSDGLFCNGAERCVSGSCQPGTNPCVGQSCDEAVDMCFVDPCDHDTKCEAGENCSNCASDCIAGGGGGCGNGVCEPSLGEDCLSCRQDCRGSQGGSPRNRFCCGDGDGAGPVTCADSRCTTSGFSCSPSIPVAYCCGDAVCAGAETSCSCALDCGAPPAEAGRCANGADDDCDGLVDCADPNCASDPACAAPVCDRDGNCEAGENCNNCLADCPGRSGGKVSGRYCCGDGTLQSAEGNGSICDGNP